MSKKKKAIKSFKKENIDFIHHHWFSWTILLFIGLIVIFFENNNISFQQGHHGFLSSHGITLAKNISFENNLLMFHNISIDAQGNQIFNAYNRFPITSFLILKSAMSLFGNNLELQIMAARYIMVLFYLGSMFLAYLSLRILLKEKILSIVIVLMSFSSFYIQYYNDMIFNDIPTLFGFLLAFHGLVIYNNDNSKFIQLLVKSLIGISLGWQVYSILLVYIIYSFFIHIRSKDKNKNIFITKYFKLGFITLVLGIVILSLQLLNESKMTNQPLNKIDTVSSMKKRMGTDSHFDKKHAHILTFDRILQVQSDRIRVMSTPVYVTSHYKNTNIYFMIIMTLFIISMFTQYKKYKNEYNILIIFALSGFIWGLGMNHFTMFHDFQSIYYIGIPIIIYGSIFSFIYNHFKNKKIVMIILLLLSLLTFVNATYTFNKIKDQKSNRTNFITHDMQIIKDKVGEKSKICVDGNVHKVCGGQHACAFYLSGNYLQKSFKQAGCDFVISNNRKYNNKPLSSQNKGVFLFEYK